MLDTLPGDVWKNKDLKWLDPAVGIGNFPAAILDRLMVGLEDVIGNEDERRKWILEEMLYMCDISIKNLFLLYKLFDENNEFKLNVYRGSFLEEGFDKHMKEVWGLDKVDIIIGNPPYLRNLHLDFLIKSYEISNITLLIHPNTWLIDQKDHTKIYLKTKELIKSSLKKCIFVNPNSAFGIKLSSPCTITLIDKTYKGKIEVFDKINQNKTYYSNIYDINKWNNYDEYYSIKLKIDEYISKRGNITEHFGDKNLTYYVNISRVRGNIDNSFDNLYSSDFFTILPKDEKVEKSFNKAFCMNFEDEEMANNFIEYLKSYITRFCYSINKNDLSNNKIDMRRIPFIDFNISWKESDIMNEFGLTNKEYNYIKSVIPKYY
jgi:predicted phosphodiesterase